MRKTSITRPDGSQALDLAAGLDRLLGDHAMHLRVLARFRADYSDIVSRLRQAVANGDDLLARRIVHTLKGAAGMVEARKLCQLAHDGETALLAHGSVAPGLADELEAELACVLAQLDTALAGPADTKAATAATSEEIARLCAMLDTGDGAAPALLEARHAAFRAVLGPERMRALDAAVSAFDFERALAVLEESNNA